MKDMQARLEKFRADAAECALIRDLATDREKRALFARLADQLTMLATEVESLLLPAETFLGRKTQEPFPSEDQW